MKKEEVKKTQDVKEDSYKVEVDKEHSSPDIPMDILLANMNTDTLPLLVQGDKMNVRYHLVLKIHNPFVHDEDGNVDYDNYVFIDEEGNGHYTGSSSFMSSYEQIIRVKEQMGLDAPVTPIEVISKDSKNNAGSMLLAKFAV